MVNEVTNETVEATKDLSSENVHTPRRPGSVYQEAA